MATEYPDVPSVSIPTTKPYTAPEVQQPTFGVSDTFDLQQQSIDSTNTGYTAPTSTPSFDTGKSFVDDNSLAVNQVGGLLDKGSMLYDIGESKGLSMAAGRGLINSDMGVEAGVRGGIAEIMPAVLNDSQLLGSADLAQQGAEYQAGIEGYNSELAGAQAQQNANIQDELNDQTAGYHAELARQDLANKGELTTQTAKYQQAEQEVAALLQSAINGQEWDNKFSEQVFVAQQTAMRERMNIEFNELIQANSVTLEQEKALSDAYMEMSKNYEISVQNILLDEFLDASGKAAALTKIQEVFDINMSNIAGIFDSSYTPATAQ